MIHLQKLRKSFISIIELNLATGWDFYFGLDRKIPKIPKSRESGPGYENHEKNLENPESKIPKIP